MLAGAQCSSLWLLRHAAYCAVGCRYNRAPVNTRAYHPIACQPAIRLAEGPPVL